jgi:hypothetical protein
MSYIKVLSYGTGSGARAIRYLLNEFDHDGKKRESVRILEGDPDGTASLIDSLDFKNKYTSVVIAFSPEDTRTEEKVRECIEEFKQVAFAGLERDEYDILVVMHDDSDVHIIVPRVHLKTGLSLNIAPPGWQSAFDPLRDAWNFENDWARPDDPGRAREVQPGPKAPASLAAAQARAEAEENGEKPGEDLAEPNSHVSITNDILELIDAGSINSRADIITALKRLGDINRLSKKSISVRLHGESKPIRLKGSIYESEFDADAVRAKRRADAAAHRRGCGVDPDTAERAGEAARRKLEKAIERRAKTNEKKYHAPRRGRRGQPGEAHDEWPENHARDRFRVSLGSRAEDEANRILAEFEDGENGGETEFDSEAVGRAISETGDACVWLEEIYGGAAGEDERLAAGIRAARDATDRACRSARRAGEEADRRRARAAYDAARDAAAARAGSAVRATGTQDQHGASEGARRPAEAVSAVAVTVAQRQAVLVAEWKALLGAGQAGAARRRDVAAELRGLEGLPPQAPAPVFVPEPPPEVDDGERWDVPK